MVNQKLSSQSRTNWLVDVVLFVSAVLAGLTGTYFLFLPSGGYRGGRNPMYGITILFDRHTWDDAHAWTGIMMIAAVVVHLIIHWQWVLMMTKRVVQTLTAKGSKLSAGAKLNLFVDGSIAISFLLTALSGLYFFFTKTGEGVRSTPSFVFDGMTWDLIHTWAFVALVCAIVAHLSIHWRWVTNVTGKFIGSFRRTRLASSKVEAPA